MISSAIRHLLEAQEARASGSALALSVVLVDLGVTIEAGLTVVLGAAEPPLRLLGGGLKLPQLEAVVATEQPDVAVLDETKVGDPAIFSTLRGLRPGIGLVVIAQGLSLPRGVQLRARGADACVDYKAPAEQMIAAVRAAGEGGNMVLPAGERWRDGARSPLTERQEQVLNLLGLGRSNSEIAATLCISQNTVHTHVQHVYDILGVHSRAELRARMGDGASPQDHPHG